MGELARLAAQLHAIDVGHHPVQDRQRGPVVALEKAPRILAIGRRNDPVAPLAERAFKDVARHHVVFRDQYSQDRMPPF
jgi:hypothetical protein